MARPLPRGVVLASLIGAVLLPGACDGNEKAQLPAAPPPAITVASVEKQDVTPSVSFNGRVEAIDSVDLRARVEGFVEKRFFEDGADVKSGDLLIQLEKGAHEAEIGQIQGQITSAEGKLNLARILVDRREKLVVKKVVAVEDLDEAQAQYTQALGELQQLKAALDRAKLELSYTDIKAPIDGRIGRFGFSVGDVVGPSSGSLAVIVSQDPMYVTFPVTARDVLDVNKTARASGQDPRAVKIKLRLPDGSIYSETGTINFVDVRVDPTTDTVMVRATIPNPQRYLRAEQLIGVIVEQAEPEQALVVPQAAVAVDQAGQYVLVVDKDSKAEQRRIRMGSPHGTNVIVTEGLKEGEHVIVEGLQKVRPGQTVATSAAATGRTEP